MAVTVESVSSGSALPAYCMSSSIEDNAEFIGIAKLHSTGGGPQTSWLPSMSAADVASTIDYLYDRLLSGVNIVSWGGVESFLLFSHHELSSDHRMRLRHVMTHHFDLKTAYFFGLTQSKDNGLDELIASAPDCAEFPHNEWLSGIREQQMCAVQFSVSSLVFLSKLFFQLDHAYFEDGRNICVGSLCNDEHVVHTFGHSSTRARRLSASIQDNLNRLI